MSCESLGLRNCPNPFQDSPQIHNRDRIITYKVDELFLLDESNWIVYPEEEISQQLSDYLTKRALCPADADAGSTDFCKPNVELNYLFIIGVGVHVTKSAGEYLKNLKDVIPPQSSANVLFNPNSLDTGVSVLARLCSINPSLNSKFIRSTVAQVRTFIQQNKHVVLYGHSYGGMIVSTVAKYLSKSTISKDIISKRLRLITMGSIYVPAPDQVQGIPLLHIMNRNDIALQCNRLKQPSVLVKNQLVILDRSRNILWLDVSGRANRFEIHTKYYDSTMVRALNP